MRLGSRRGRSIRDVWDVLVVGGGPAGVTAALRARELGASVALVERGRFGGTCTNDGCVPTRVWAKAARLLRDAAQFADYGLVGDAPRLDFTALRQRTQETVQRLHDKKQIARRLEECGIFVFGNAGDAAFQDEHTLRLQRGETLTAKAFLLCVGGHARDLSFPGSDLTLSPTQLWSLDTLPRSVVVVGASATGCQLASILDTFGVRVSLLEMEKRLLPREDVSLSEAMATAYAEREIQVLTGIGPVERVERSADGGQGARLRVHFSREERPQQIDADAVIIATGWTGSVESLNLSAAGVTAERGYISVDDYLCTSAPHIFAAGDVTGRMMLVQSAYDEARVAAENAVCGTERRDTHRIVPHGGFTDPEYGSVGITEADADPEDAVTALVPYADLDRALIDRRTEGFCKLIASRSTHRLLGAHVVGEQALEVVQVIAGGMAARMTVDHLADLELAYPTFTGILGLAARQISREMGLVRQAGNGSGADHPRATEWEHRAGTENGDETEQ
jgi:pyruvate/2-oxoglutarate dehydrogenase complex dihydrolipoamide dehydrogenase (E3) component